MLIGIGNPTRGDDAAGLEVARRMKHVESHQRVAGDYDLMTIWEGADEVIVVDAARSGARVGTVHRFNPRQQPLPQGVLTASTHAIGLAHTIEMARRLSLLPPRITVYGIEVSDIEPGSGLSPAVQEAVGRLVHELDHA